MKICPHCHLEKKSFHSNGRCADCESERHKALYWSRKLEWDAPEAREATYQDERSELQPTESQPIETAVITNEFNTVPSFCGLASGFLRQSQRRFNWKAA